MPATGAVPADLLPTWLTSPEPLVSGALVFIAVVIATALVRYGLTRALDRGESDRRMGLRLGRFVGLIVFVAGTVYALGVAGVQVGPLLGALGVGGIALAFAAQDILQNFVAGVLIQLRRPFRVGDQISSLGFDGTVLDIDLRAVRVLTFDGLDLILPAAEVLKAPITNHTRTPNRRTTIEVGVAYDTDLETARRVILDTVPTVPGVQADPPPAAFVREFADSAITIDVMYWHRSESAVLRQVRNDVAMAVKRRLDEHGIEIAFPQRTVWLRRED
jgi:small-conductance mechanosensitive channel